MKKLLFRLNINDYEPEITALTYPLFERYAKKIGAEIVTINQRKFPEWDLDYEKLQIYQISKDEKADWMIYIDSDAVIHPELPDLTNLIPRDTIAHNGMDFAPIRWTYDEAGYFQRDGRHLGSCNWLAIGSYWCRDLWRPLDDLTPEQAVANITPIIEEQRTVVTASHLVSDYALSRNIARFGLKATTLIDLWKSKGLNPNFFWHAYTIPPDEKLIEIRKVIKDWKLG